MRGTYLIKEYRLHVVFILYSVERNPRRTQEQSKRRWIQGVEEAESRCRGGGFKAHRRGIQGAEEFHHHQCRQGRTSREGLHTFPALLFLYSRHRGGGFKGHRSSIAVGVEKGGQAEKAFAACRHGYSSAALYVAGTTEIGIFWSPSILPQSIYPS